MLDQIIRERALPSLLPREEMLDIIQNELFGKLPPAPDSISFEAQDNYINRFGGGKGYCKKITAHCRLGEKTFSFPFYSTFPSDGKKHPFFIHINFDHNVPSKYMPSEELTDNGFAVLSFGYKDITSDDGDFSTGLAAVLYPDGTRAPDGTGKIGMWAWAAQRVMDYAQTLPEIFDLDGSVVCGHSRLGKTALFTAATDTRFAFAYSNESGCSGAALARGTTGETVADICNRFPYWFCENYIKYSGNESSMPFDQHFLIASIAPRRVLIGSADGDSWACPPAEQLCCVAASPAFEKGLECEDRFAESGEAFLSGDLGYHMRRGIHYFSRDDWHRLMEFVKLHYEGR